MSRIVQLQFSDEWLTKSYMRTQRTATLKLHKDGTKYYLTSLGGYPVTQEVRLLNCWRSNMRDWRVALRFRFEGSVWCGSGPAADGSEIKCRRTKLKGLYAK